MRLVLRPAADRELTDAFRWYAERSSDLAVEFLLAVDDSLRDVREHPQAFPLVRPRLRRCLLAQFPYTIYYSGAESTIRVLAVVHSPRQPRRD